MKQATVLTISLVIILILSGCNSFSDPKISEDEAKRIVIENSTITIGKVEIQSISREWNKYVIRWENKDNCESGTDYVHIQSGELTEESRAIC
ncbi:putative periplasmic lipoprotein [Jeotgalibacillus campisalis]|uniref:Lipoprotein n=1 Tax=Jeotgalibacillus campisalis TaxID=220754 RepID=A0A0C2SFR3_9BACL|nr:hypothetical protein [Jeotgalibacillus campisalis]KIL52769.1 hypothetical protein KR50_00980 [Jeotgalibacillus campisalis]